VGWLLSTCDLTCTLAGLWPTVTLLRPAHCRNSFRQNRVRERQLPALSRVAHWSAPRWAACPSCRPLFL